MPYPPHRDIHYWRRDLVEPPCEPLEDGFEWSDDVADVTCQACKESLAGDAGDLAAPEGLEARAGDGEAGHAAR